MDNKTALQYLQLSDRWNAYRHSYLSDGLALAQDYTLMIQHCELRPLYDMNLLDFCNPKEPITSRMLAQILSYHDKDGYVVFKSFCQVFLAECGFDCRNISEPEITSERNGHMDIRITETDKYAVVIENKLKGAYFQKNQLARYIQKLMDEGYGNDQIFIVILPQSKNIRINPSAWRLPPDHKSTTNSTRKCGTDNYKLCWCDFPQRSLSKEQKEHCKDCIKYWEETFAGQTKVLHDAFSEWLIDAESLVPKRELNVRSAIIQFADYLNGLYDTRINQKLNNMITIFLREKLELGASAADLKKLNTKISEIEELEEGLKKLRTEISSDLIDLWHDNLIEKWPTMIYEPRQFFVVLIKGMYIGCWWAEESDSKDSPIWGILCEEGIPTSRQIKIAEKIISYCGLHHEIDEDQWLVYDNTLEGEKIADKLYTAASELGYLK